MLTKLSPGRAVPAGVARNHTLGRRGGPPGGITTAGDEVTAAQLRDFGPDAYVTRPALEDTANSSQACADCVNLSARSAERRARFAGLFAQTA